MAIMGDPDGGKTIFLWGIMQIEIPRSTAIRPRYPVDMATRRGDYDATTFTLQACWHATDERRAEMAECDWAGVHLDMDNLLFPNAFHAVSQVLGLRSPYQSSDADADVDAGTAPTPDHILAHDLETEGTEMDESLAPIFGEEVLHIKRWGESQRNISLVDVPGMWERALVTSTYPCLTAHVPT